jgi:hypothetical protein
MKKTVRKTLCLLIILLIVSPSLIRAQKANDELIGCDENDIECIADVVSQSIARSRSFIKVVQNMSASWMAHNSSLFNVDWRFDANGQMVFKSLFPGLTKLIEKDVASKYGIVLPIQGAMNQKALDGGLIVGAIALGLYTGELYDGAFNQERINAMVTDLERRGYSPENARVEANQQFLEQVQPNSQSIAAIANAVVPGAGVPVFVGNLLRDLKILGSGNYFNLWAQFHRSEIRAIMQEQAAGRRGPDTGRSYIEWAARREGSLGGSSGSFGNHCSAWIHYPATEVWDPVTQTLTYTPARNVCIVNSP